jgi:hypothetical protein
LTSSKRRSLLRTIDASGGPTVNRTLKYVLLGTVGAASVGVAGIIGLVALGWFLQSKGLVPPQAAASQVSPSSPSGPTTAPSPSGPAPESAEATPAPARPALNAAATTLQQSAAPSPATSLAKASSPTGIVASLEALEAQGEFGQLGAHIFNNAQTMTANQRTQVREWLEARLGWSRVPVLFLLSRIHEADGDMAKAAEYFAAGGVAYRIDAQCVIDRTGRGAVEILQEHMPRVREYIGKTKGEIARVVRWGLDKEEELKDREPAAWIVAHGLVSIRTGLVESGVLPGVAAEPANQSPYVSAQEREQVRAEIRAGYEKMIERNRDK